MSFKDNLYNLVKEKGLVTYGELVSFSMEENYKPDTMTRRMRELCDQKGIEPLEKTGKRNQKYIYAYRLVSEPREYGDVEAYKTWDEIKPFAVINGNKVTIFAPKVEKLKQGNKLFN